MQVELISIGDELLIGQTINTNAAWLGKTFSELGLHVQAAHTIADDETEILSTLSRTVKPGTLVVITGGLGPTKDDITKHTLCTFFGTSLELNQEVLKHVSSFFEKRGRPMLESNIRQADFPKTAEVLHNALGTAPGMWFERDGAIVVSLPGVPYEMKGIIESEVIPRLLKRVDTNPVFYKTVLTQGIGESFLAEKMADWENRLRGEGLSLAYLPSPGQVKLRISSKEGRASESRIDDYMRELGQRLPQYVFGQNLDTLASVIAGICIEKKLTLGTVESCTAGGIAAEITAIPGSSAYFLGGLVTYSNELKSKLAGVNPETIRMHGAVSRETVTEMCENGRKVLETDYCIAVSGVAGPDGGSEINPVGSVWIGIAGPNRTFVRKFVFGDDRSRNIRMTIGAALNVLRCEILGIALDSGRP